MVKRARICLGSIWLNSSAPKVDNFISEDNGIEVQACKRLNKNSVKIILNDSSLVILA